jgi:hypothetical protein
MALGEKRITIRADRKAKGHAVMVVFGAAQEAQFEKIMVVGEVPTTQPEGRATPAAETPATETKEATP